MTIEACVDTLEQSMLAQENGADRLELCSHLELDGLSPDIELIEKVLDHVTIPVKIMVRLRPGNFVYTSKEVEMMIHYILQCTSLPIDGFVVGMLTQDMKIDLNHLNRLLYQFPDHPFTFHKAIDLVNDPIQEMIKCNHLKNLTHILTSGKMSTAMEGISMIHKMVAFLEPRFKIIAAGKVTQENLTIIRRATGAEEFHGRNILS